MNIPVLLPVSARKFTGGGMLAQKEEDMPRVTKTIRPREPEDTGAVRKPSVANALRDELVSHDLRRTSQERLATAFALGVRDETLYARAHGMSRRRAAEAIRAIRAMGRKASRCAGLLR